MKMLASDLLNELEIMTQKEQSIDLLQHQKSVLIPIINNTIELQKNLPYYKHFAKVDKSGKSEIQLKKVNNQIKEVKKVCNVFKMEFKKHIEIESPYYITK